MRDPLTKPQRETLEFIRSYRKKHDYAPTVREIAEELEISPSAAHERVQNLSARGWLAIRKRAPRGITIK